MKIVLYFQAIISSTFLQFSAKLKTKCETIITLIQARTATKLCNARITINSISLRVNCQCHWALREKTVDDFMRYATPHAKERERENNSRECNAVFHGRVITVFLRANSRSLDNRPRITAFILPRISARAKNPDVNRSNLDDNATICHTSSIGGWHAVF